MKKKRKMTPAAGPTKTPKPDPDYVERRLSRDSVKINLNELEVECAAQPDMVQAVGEWLADAKQDVDDAEAALELTKAEVEFKVRNKHPDYKEAAVKAGVLSHPLYQKRKRILNKKKRAQHRLEADMKALDHKKSSLQTLAQLHGQMYWAKPSTLKEVKELDRRVEQLRKAARRLGYDVV